MFNYMRAQDVAEILGVSLHQVYRRLQRGELRSVYHGRCYLIHRDEVASYLGTQSGPRYLTLRQTAEMTFLPIATVRQLCHFGVFKHHRIGLRNPQLHIDPQSVRAFQARYMDVFD